MKEQALRSHALCSFMKAAVLLLLCAVMVACTEQVTVVAIEETDRCLSGYKVITTFDSPSGRFKRCGWWGKVGETFQLNRFGGN